MTLTMNLGVDSYDIVVERGALSKAGKYLNLDRRVLVVTDSGVPKEYSEKASSFCKDAVVYTFPEGEESKNFDTFKSLLSCLVENGFTRSDCVLSVGGGVCSDMAGFAAATYMRGIDFYSIPTTLLSQIDASIGGKTAIDFCGYKNIVGAFKQPKKVIIDPDVLLTLDKRQIANGMSEAVKMSLTSDNELFTMFENGEYRTNLDEVIVRSLKIKKYVVEQDEKETGLRKILNFGHTVAHAIESNMNLAGLYHGECVGLGMLCMCSENVRERLYKVMKDIGLPTEFDFDVKKITEAVKHDKKMSGDNITVIYVNEPGTFEMKTVAFSEFENQLSKVL